MRYEIKEYRYIYNPIQANFYIQNNLQLIETGIGQRGDLYFKFKDSNKLQEVFKKWMEQRVMKNII